MIFQGRGEWRGHIGPWGWGWFGPEQAEATVEAAVGGEWDKQGLQGVQRQQQGGGDLGGRTCPRRFLGEPNQSKSENCKVRTRNRVRDFFKTWIKWIKCNQKWIGPVRSKVILTASIIQLMVAQNNMQDV